MALLFLFSVLMMSISAFIENTCCDCRYGGDVSIESRLIRKLLCSVK